MSHLALSNVVLPHLSCVSEKAHSLSDLRTQDWWSEESLCSQYVALGRVVERWRLPK